MSTLELKREITQLINSNKNDELLAQIHRILLLDSNPDEDDHWDGLTPNQRNEILTAWEESFDEASLISYEDFKREL
jgi:hypothetical protein